MQQHLNTAGFFMEGLHDAQPAHKIKRNYDILIDTWGQGCIELVDTLVSYVPLTTTLQEAAAMACDGNYPGVFDYEVSSAFGKWFGEHILAHGIEPSQIHAHNWLITHIGAFFAQDLTEQQAEKIKAAINDAFVLAIRST